MKEHYFMPIFNAIYYLHFSNHQEQEKHCSLIHLDHSRVVFEVYHPFLKLQANEIINSLQIGYKTRLLYEGRAIVNDGIRTGNRVIIIATLIDAWNNRTTKNISKKLFHDMTEWKQQDKGIRSNFCLIIKRISNFLTNLNTWLEHNEINIIPSVLEQNLARNLTGIVNDNLQDLFDEFEVIVSEINEPFETQVHKNFARAQILPLILCAPFVYRSYTKPLGYAGDYEMVNMIFRDPNEGASTYAQMLNIKILDMVTATAHRNRIHELVKILTEESRAVLSRKERFKVLNVGCGPAKEIQMLIEKGICDQHWEIELLDFDEEALIHTRAQIESRMPSAHVRYTCKSIYQFLKEDRHASRPQNQYDMIYCAGLFDYLSDKVCAKLLAIFETIVLPGGIILSTNVHVRNPTKGFMEYFLDWHLTYRHEKDMKKLVPKNIKPQIYCEELGINILMMFRTQPN
ncbi:MAG: class I SAM-dependent methyltransferase [Pseudomonadota bacterium]|nr:class I SAM-dependent methyltransferase [Pseudomonadota bacterium]